MVCAQPQRVPPPGRLVATTSTDLAPADIAHDHDPAVRVPGPRKPRACRSPCTLCAARCGSWSRTTWRLPRGKYRRLILRAD